MDGDVVIRAEKLGKKYVIGTRPAATRTLSLTPHCARSWPAKPSKRCRAPSNFCAENGRRESAPARNSGRSGILISRCGAAKSSGIIGRNGAGKITLLKVLSRITEPSEGRVTMKGRVASLLEVGTGFHPELTGRENIYLNGAVLGMARAEVRRKFDEIVEFAEVERFLDTPVKRYSSGMYVRLAFAVAAFLEQDILVVDEVLAVGDTEFQKKCLGKMSDVAHGGRTILFVSHNMGSVASLCRSANSPAQRLYRHVGTGPGCHRQLSDRVDCRHAGKLRAPARAAVDYWGTAR